MEDCSKCGQTVENCECHIPDEEKHAGLYNLCNMLLGDKGKPGNHYVTFGQVHVHSVDGKTLDKDTVAVFKAKDYAEGRAKAFEYFGDKFFTDYHGEQWKADSIKYFPKGYVELGVM